MSKEIYVSVDIETDGPIPGEYSMLSIGAAAFSAEGKLLKTFSSNLTTLEGAKQHPNTMTFWKENPEAWEACRQHPQEHPSLAMTRFYNWTVNLRDYGGSPVFVAYPVGFDFTFVYWYLMKYVGKSPFSFSAIDIRTYAMAMLKKDYFSCSKKGMPKHWVPKHKHTHVAIDDAIEQGQLFINMLKENNGKK